MQSPYLEIAIDPVAKLVRATRTAAPLSSPLEVDEITTFARGALAALARAPYGLLLDLRHALLSDETRYAEGMRMVRRELSYGFRRRAFLVATQIGALQTRRFIREEALDATVFDNEAEALAFLRAP